MIMKSQGTGPVPTTTLVRVFERSHLVQDLQVLESSSKFWSLYFVVASKSIMSLIIN